MSDFMHIPLLVKYNYESHAAAGALVALGIDSILEGHTSKGKRLLISIGSTLAIGTFKEYCLDKHPHNREIAPWGLGAAAVLSFKYSF